MHRVKKIEYLDGYKLRLHFKNGMTRIVDLEGELKDAKNKFRDLKDIDYFKKVECDGISIRWPNDIDFCPDWLYMHSQPESKSTIRKKPAKSTSKRAVRRRRIAAKA